MPFGFRRGDEGELVPHEAEQEAIREMVALRAQRKPLRAIAAAMAGKGQPRQSPGRGGYREGCERALRAAGPSRLTPLARQESRKCSLAFCPHRAPRRTFERVMARIDKVEMVDNPCSHKQPRRLSASAFAFARVIWRV